MLKIFSVKNGLNTITCYVENVNMETITSQFGEEYVTEDNFPEDLTLFDAWEINGDNIKIPLEKAKPVAHNIRRARREEIMKPLDTRISFNIPDEYEILEAERSKVRENDNIIQHNINSADNVDELSHIIQEYVNAPQ